MADSASSYGSPFCALFIERQRRSFAWFLARVAHPKFMGIVENGIL